MTDSHTHAVAREASREANGQFGAQRHSAPEAELSPDLANSISTYLHEYEAERGTYAEESEGSDADGAYERWEDFQTDNSSRAYMMLEEAKSEIERLRTELEAERTKHLIPQELADAIDEDHAHLEEPLLYVPEDGHQDGWVDVIAVADDVHRKYTLTPDGTIERNFG